MSTLHEHQIPYPQPLCKVQKAAAPAGPNPEVVLPPPLHPKLKVISKKSIEDVAMVLDFSNDR
jgi:hypothetical protein